MPFGEELKDEHFTQVGVAIGEEYVRRFEVMQATIDRFDQSLVEEHGRLYALVVKIGSEVTPPKEK